MRDHNIDASLAIELRHVYKVFGRRAEEAVPRLEAGESRDDVQKDLGAVGAVIDASIEVPRGSIFVVMGLSGSGKSTLVRMINRLFEPTAGQVIVDGEDITDADAKELRRLRADKISMVFQHFALLPHRTVRDNASFGLETRDFPKEERAERAQNSLDLVGLGQWGDKFPSELSGGMRQRVGLARALATEAPILLMDEAFSALDPLIKREMQDQLLELQENLQRTIVFITHDLKEAMRLGDQIAVMREGRLVQVGTSEEILEHPENDYVESFVADVDRSRVLTAESAMVEPVARIQAREGAAAAMQRMQELQVSSLFVVGADRRLMGAVHDSHVAAAVRRHEHRLEAVMDDRVLTAAPDDLLVDLFAPSCDSVLPLAVVDETGRLKGVLPRVSLLGALAGAEPDPTQEPTLPSGEVSGEVPTVPSTGDGDSISAVGGSGA